MRWVQAAQARPHRCSFIPFIGGHHPEGFFDAGTEIMAFDGHVYCSVVAARQMAEMMGWAPAGDANLKAKVAELEGTVREKDEEIAALQVQLDAVRVLKNGGFVQANPPGRPRKVAA